VHVDSAGPVIGFDGASFLLQWAAGGLLFLWVTTRGRIVSLGYGWLMRATYGLMALGSWAVGAFVIEPMPVRDYSALACAIAAFAVLGASIARRSAGVSGHVERAEARTARVAAMTGIERDTAERDEGAHEFDPRLDLIGPVLGFVGVVAAGVAAPAGDAATWLAVARFVVGAAFLGAVTDAMLLGHWYLVQPGLPRGPLLEMVRWTGWLWVPQVLLLFVPPGMQLALSGQIDDGYGGLLGWFWLACALTTGGLVVVTRLALRERQYSAVMAATGLLYLAILTAFGTDLVARALLA
jgi:hypothetical protein